MTLRLNGSSSGYTEIDAPAAAGSNTLTLPTGNGSANQFLKNSGTAGTLEYSSTVEDSSNNLQFNSGYGSVATAYGCRAWVNFNGTGTVAIRDSGNVSSITDNGTGNYTIAFTTAMPDANYCVVTTCSYAPTITETMLTTVNGDSLFTTGGFNAKSRDNGAVLRDVNYFFAAVFR